MISIEILFVSIRPYALETDETKFVSHNLGLIQTRRILYIYKVESILKVEQKHTLEGSTHASKDKEVGESSDHATTHLQPKPSLDKEGLKQIFTGLGGYFVNFCFAQRFLQTFNEQGTVKMSSFIKNDAEQEYGLKLYDMMDREILNTG